MIFRTSIFTLFANKSVFGIFHNITNTKRVRRPQREGESVFLSAPVTGLISTPFRTIYLSSCTLKKKKKKKKKTSAVCKIKGMINYCKPAELIKLSP